MGSIREAIPTSPCDHESRILGTTARLGPDLECIRLHLLQACKPALHFRKGVSLAILVALTMTLAISLKNQIARPRPTPTTEVALSQGSERSLYGMPSSHAVFFALMAGVAGARWHRWGVRVIAASVALGLGMIRVAEGLHYPTDVLAGWGLGLACGTLGWLAIKNAFSAKTRSADIQSVQ